VVNLDLQLDKKNQNKSLLCRLSKIGFPPTDKMAFAVLLQFPVNVMRFALVLFNFLLKFRIYSICCQKRKEKELIKECLYGQRYRSTLAPFNIILINPI